MIFQKLNQKIIARDDVKELFVQPAASDAGTAIGAATYAIAARGIELDKMEHVYLGPEFSNEQCIAANALKCMSNDCLNCLGCVRRLPAYVQSLACLNCCFGPKIS